MRNSANFTTVIDGKSWREFYLAALCEKDTTKLCARVAEAEWAVTIRARELAYTEGDHIEEKSDLEDAFYALNALRNVPRDARSQHSGRSEPMRNRYEDANAGTEPRNTRPGQAA
jgi:hypothetical protein